MQEALIIDGENTEKYVISIYIVYWVIMVDSIDTIVTDYQKTVAKLRSQ
jgi:hypothetical protein